MKKTQERKYKVTQNGMYTRFTPIAQDDEKFVNVTTCWQDGTQTTKQVLMSKEEREARVAIPSRKLDIDFDGEEMAAAKAWAEKMRSDLSTEDDFGKAWDARMLKDAEKIDEIIHAERIS